MHYVYIVRCNDNTLYTGYTTDLEKRIEKHNQGKGAKYTRTRAPVTLEFCEEHETKSAALKKEHLIKQLTKKRKEQLIFEAKLTYQTEEKDKEKTNLETNGFPLEEQKLKGHKNTPLR